MIISFLKIILKFKRIEMFDLGANKRVCIHLTLFFYFYEKYKNNILYICASFSWFIQNIQMYLINIRINDRT